MVVADRPADTVGEVAGDVGTTVTGDVIGGAPEVELAHEEHVAARMITTAGNRIMCRRSEMTSWFHVRGFRTDVSSETVQ